MNREAIIAGLRDEIERLTQVLELLGEAAGVPSPRTQAEKQPLIRDGRRGKRGPEVRARMALAQQKASKGT